MRSAEHWLVHEHTQFEVLVRECRDAADIADWWALENYFRTLMEQLRYHMAQEEEVLFPAYDAMCDSSHVSTLELLNEHSVIVDCFRQLDKFIQAKSSKEAYDCIVNLELQLLAHNEREEKTFLPFASRLLFEERDELLFKLDNFVITSKTRDWNA